MVVPFSADWSRIEKALSFETIFVEQVYGPIAQRSFQPIADGHTESDLGSLEQIARDIFRQDIAQDPFSGSLLDLKFVRQRPCEFDDAVVEQWRPCLQRHTHAG